MSAIVLNNCAGMVDIETESTQPNAKILSIAAVLFDPFVLNTTEELFAGHTFYMNVRPDSQPESHTDPDTLQWWQNQSQEARDAVLTDQRHITDVLAELRKFLVWRGSHDALNAPKATSLWANSPSFDAVILNQAYHRYSKFSFPIPFWGWKDCRTANELAWPNGEGKPAIRVGTAHNALDDCVKQIHYVQAAYRIFGHH